MLLPKRMLYTELGHAAWAVRHTIDDTTDARQCYGTVNARPKGVGRREGGVMGGMGDAPRAGHSASSDEEKKPGGQCCTVGQVPYFFPSQNGAKEG